jgi:hypothetical protein
VGLSSANADGGVRPKLSEEGSKMKIRMRGNSVRLRLTRGEVARLAAVGRVEEATEFGLGPEARLIYSLASSAVPAAMRALTWVGDGLAPEDDSTGAAR